MIIMEGGGEDAVGILSLFLLMREGWASLNPLSTPWLIIIFI